MQTLTQYEYLDKDMVLKGVCEWIVKESPILQKLPFFGVQGNSYKYNVELTLPTASWLTVGDQIAESTGTFEQRTTDIYTMIANSYTDKSKIELNSTQDPESIDVAMAAKAMAHEFEKTFVIGQTSVDNNSNQFKGLLRIIAEFESSSTTDLDAVNNSQVIANDATSGALTTAKMDELIDAVKPGKADFLLMSRHARRKVNALQRASGNAGTLITDKDQFGSFMSFYDGIPIFINDFLLNNFYNNASSVQAIATYDYDTTRTTDYDNTIIFAGKWGEKGVCGLNAGEMKHEREEFVENYNAICNRFVWYCGAACFSKYSLACLTGINPDS